MMRANCSRTGAASSLESASPYAAAGRQDHRGRDLGPASGPRPASSTLAVIRRNVVRRLTARVSSRLQQLENRIRGARWRCGAGARGYR